LQKSAGYSSYTTIVTGFFTIPGNQHRDQATYISYMKQFLPLIETPMVIYTSRQGYPLLSGLRGSLPAIYKLYSSTWDLEPARNYKHVYEHQFDDHPEWKEQIGCAAPECSAVWNAKPWMVAQAAAENPSNSSYFMWVDPGSFCWGEHGFRHWPDSSVVKFLAENHSKEVVQQVVRFPASHAVWGHCESHFVAGGWFGGTKPMLDWYAHQFQDVLVRRIALGLYAAQEQCMMNAMALMHSDKFLIIDDRWHWSNGWRRAYEESVGSARCNVPWYLQFHVQLASQEELLLHTATLGCQKVPFQRMLPVVTSYDLTAVAWDPDADTASGIPGTNQQSLSDA
jgi:hypothetical protein